MSNLTPTPPATGTLPGHGVGLAGILIGLVIPFIGIILGIVALVKRNVPMGLGAVIVSVIAWVVWTMVLMG
jgi:hypothetical protein